ncbi:MAG: protein kinase [Marinicellaceae bacterium]
MTHNISDWKLAKELCEKAAELNIQDKIKFIQSSQSSQSIKDKALKIVSKLNDDFDLIENTSFEKFLPHDINANNLVGKIIDNYKLLSVIGTGGMSSVYLAKRTQSDIQKHVALKILSPYHTAQKYLELFYREQQSLAQLNHKNIISFHHGGQTEDGTHYLVMDYIENAKDVMTHCEMHNLNLVDRLKIVQTIAKAMTYAHHNNIIHRDLKSANVLVDSNNEIKILDFGIAFITNAENNSADSTKVFTIDIASPEQIQGHKVDARTDIFSLGAMLLHLITNQTPLPDIKLNQYHPIDVQKHVEKVLKSSKLNKDLINIIKKAMHIDVERRYASMQDFTNDLDLFLNFKPIKASKDSFFYKTQKLIKRNQIVSGLIFILFITTIAAVYFINNFSSQSQKAHIQKENSLSIINALFAQADPFKSGKNSQELVSTLESIEKQQFTVLSSDPEFRFHFYENMAIIYKQNGNYSESLKAKNKSIQALNQFVQPDGIELLDNEVEQLGLFHATGQFEKTIEESHVLLKRIATNPQAKPILTLKVYTSLGRAHGSLSELNEQTKIHELSIDFINKHPEIDTGYVVDLLASMAITQFRMGNRSLANELFEKAIDDYQKLPERKTSLAGTIRNYAATQVNYGHYEKAEKLFEQSINILINIDPKHPNLASIYLRYASLLSKTGRIQKAEKLLLNAIDIFKEVNDDVELAIAYSYIAELELRRNSIKSASKYILMSNQLLIKQRGLDHPKTLKTYNLALWITLLSPFKQEAKNLLDFLDSQDYINSKQSKEYLIYKIQKSLFNQQPSTENNKLALLSQYWYEEIPSNAQQKIKWIEDNLEKAEKQTPLINAYLQLWFYDLNNQPQKIETLCHKDKHWNYSARLALKINFIQQCLFMADKYDLKKSDYFENQLELINQRIKENQNTIQKMTSNMTQILTNL